MNLLVARSSQVCTANYEAETVPEMDCAKERIFVRSTVATSAG